ncbi:hypothetical protein SCH01S_50_00050 [Sphingomonas changbaiensis NBRC 104936]|uniref:1,4-alpha-glucan branching enzyme n=1 Tax=Sphingomonas changbaiensis NBRC 104936 TaxID=1219043 RepID=A0A0E9MT31_9SPHN|nr:hypothetical protein [Sphingomonas changbaiensis]GAO40638.1 hypothetical protein SCH01S_50_00050 [Sphingomonas changbaiensis NBRC 104936]
MSKTTTDHDEIRRWAESKGGKPAAVERTHEDGDVGIIRLMFPENRQSEHGSLVEIGWDEFFKQFDEAELALIYDENSMFSKLIGRDTAEKRAHGDNDASRHENRGRSDSGGRSDTSGSRSGDGGSDLKSREYVGEDGKTHHHTHPYMKEHG